MTISIILVVLALGVPVVIRLTKGHATPPQIGQMRTVDLRAFQNLMDPEEEEYLRRNLCPNDFHRIQRERMRAAIEYIHCAAFNAAVLMRFAEVASRSGDPAAAQAAVKLIDNAIRLRSYAFRAIPKLYLAMAFPGRRVSPARVVESYEQMARQVVLLGLQYPTGEIARTL
jgi:hypothetical protein